MDKPARKFVPKSVRLMDQVREVLRFHHYAYNTEKSYSSWILKYIRFPIKNIPGIWARTKSRLISATLRPIAMFPRPPRIRPSMPCSSFIVRCSAWRWTWISALRVRARRNACRSFSVAGKSCSSSVGYKAPAD